MIKKHNNEITQTHTTSIFPLSGDNLICTGHYRS
jgi:hypothetical protein